MLKMTEVFSEIEKCYAGLRGPDFLKSSSICEFVLHIDTSSFSKKLNGHRKFVPRELSALARHFELGEDGTALFQLKTAAQFREALKKRGIGKYTTSPAIALNSDLWEMAKTSKAVLEFHNLEVSPAHRNGFELLPTAEPNHDICLSKGTATQFKFNFPVEQNATHWLLLLNIHTENVNILNPTHEGDRLSLQSSPTIFPQKNQVRIHRDHHLGHHRLYALSLTISQISVVVGELARLRQLRYGNQPAEDITVNSGQLTLDLDATRRIYNSLTTNKVECAALDYIQV